MAIPYDHGKNRLGLRGDASELHLLLAQPLMLGLSKNRVNDAYHALMVIFFVLLNRHDLTPKFISEIALDLGVPANNLVIQPDHQTII